MPLRFGRAVGAAFVLVSCTDQPGPTAASDAGVIDASAHDASVDAGSPDASMDAGVPRWPRPGCLQVTGHDGFTFSFSEGRSVAPTAGTLTGVKYTYGVVALGAPGVVLSVHDGQLLRSVDSGCTWTPVGPIRGGFPVALVAAGEDRAYAWSDNNPELFRIDGTTITALGSPTQSVHGMAVDPNDPNHVRIAGDDGQLFDSTNAGERFAPIGTPAFPGNGLVYRIAFDPHDIERAFAGAAGDGARVTENGGMTWSPVGGLGDDRNHRFNVFSLAVSPASRDVVWFEGIDITESLGNPPNEGRYLWVSKDGGRTTSAELTRTASVTLINGNLLVPHPTEADVLYFVFGTYFQGYGTDLYRYDAASSELTIAHNGFDDINAIDFVPGDPGAMLLGVSSEDVNE